MDNFRRDSIDKLIDAVSGNKRINIERRIKNAQDEIEEKRKKIEGRKEGQKREFERIFNIFKVRAERIEEGYRYEHRERVTMMRAQKDDELHVSIERKKDEIEQNNQINRKQIKILRESIQILKAELNG